MRLRLGSQAQADVVDIIEFGVEHFGFDRATAYLDRIEERFRQLRDFPESGRTEFKLRPELRSTSCHSHRIYYTIDGDVIIIQRVLHMSRDILRWLG